MGQGWHDCDPAVRHWVETTTGRLADRLGPGHVGTWLHGSLAAGSFHPPKSDVDVLFVVQAPLTPAEREGFARACAALSEDRPLLGGLECSVLLAEQAALVPHPLPYEVHWGQDHADDVLGGSVDFSADRTDADLVAHVQAIHEVGIALAGPPASEVFGPVDRDDFLDSVHRDAAWILEGTHILESPYYGVLNACRMLWLWRGRSERLVPSKEEAGEWALGVLPARLTGVVREALDAYRDPLPVPPEARRTAGRRWDRGALLAFRDHVRAVAPRAVRDLTDG